VLRADISVVECFGFFCRKRQDLFNTRRVRYEPGRRFFCSRTDLFLDFQPRGFEINSHISEHGNRSALSQADETKKEVFGADEIVVEAYGFLAGKRQYVLSTGCEVIEVFNRWLALDRLPGFSRHWRREPFPKSFQPVHKTGYFWWSYCEGVMHSQASFDSVGMAGTGNSVRRRGSAAAG
jgi:hypothetical protein